MSNSPAITRKTPQLDRAAPILSVRGLQAPALGLLANPSAGLAGAILGYPENGPLDAEAARIGRTQRVITQDAYGRGPVARLLTPLRGRVRSGNSGGPVVDSAGRVLTTVFAGTVSGGPRGGYGVANATLTAALDTGRAGDFTGVVSFATTLAPLAEGEHACTAIPFAVTFQ